MEVPRLHPDTVEEVKQRVDIVDVIADYVVLKKRGKDYQGLCPFHDEKTPSFSVSPVRQMYYCFGCGAGGNAIKFLMELGKRSFSDVVLDLAQRYQVPIKTLEPEQKKELQRQLSLREQLYEVLAVASHFYQHTLHQPQGEKALNYLYQTRGLTAGTIQHFQLGYAPDGWSTLYRYLVEQKHYAVALVVEAGLIKPRKNNDGYYDQFRDRLMIPIADSQGRIIAFGSRTLGSDEPKYLNSPETPLFNKGKTLFGLDKAKNSIQKRDKAIIVEGYFDVIALQSVGITNTVAALGTALSQEQIKLLLRYTDSKQIIFNFDADKAGVKATQRAIAEIEPLVYSGQVNLRILNLPAGKDADEFLKASSQAVEEYENLVNNAPLWLDWQIQQLLIHKNLKQADHFEQVAQEMLKLLNQLEDGNKRTYYLQKCAEILSQGDTQTLSIQANNLLSQLKKGSSIIARRPIQTSKKIEKISQEKTRLEIAEALLLRLYLHCPDCRTEITELLESKDLLFNFYPHRFLWQKIQEIQTDFPSLADPDNQLLSRLQDIALLFPESMQPTQYLFHLNEKTNEDLSRPSLHVLDAIAVLEIAVWKNYSQHCQKQLQEFHQRQATEGSQYYWQELKKAKDKIETLNKERLNHKPSDF
jgi:DNA primase